MQTIQVWAVTMVGKHFDMNCCGLFMTEEEARGHVASWCNQWWEHEHGLVTKPEDQERLIEAYFHHVEDESYTVSQVELPASIVEAINTLQDTTEALANVVLHCGWLMSESDALAREQTVAKARAIYRALFGGPEPEAEA